MRVKKKKRKKFIPVQMLFFVTLFLSAALGWKEGGGGVGTGQQMGIEDEIFKVTWETGMLSSH